MTDCTFPRCGCSEREQCRPDKQPVAEIDLTQFEGHTPGPWSWFGNAPHDIYLATKHSGRTYVMGFHRWGFTGAQPVFRGERVMQDASELITFEVGDRDVKGYAAAKSDPSVYRYQIDGVDHPDARLIAAAPDLLAAYKAALARAEAADRIARGWKALADAREARAETAERQSREAFTAGAEAMREAIYNYVYDEAEAMKEQAYNLIEHHSFRPGERGVSNEAKRKGFIRDRQQIAEKLFIDAAHIRTLPIPAQEVK